MGRRVNQSMYYNRQSKGYQQNVMKKQMADAGYAKGMPTAPNPKKLKRTAIIGAIAATVITVVLTILFKWTGFLIGLGIVILATGGFVLYLRNKEKAVVRAYKKMGMPKKEYMNFLKKNTKQPLKKKDLDKLSKEWDKIKV